MNISVKHGIDGENLATEYLQANAYLILDRNSRPCVWDHRKEIDIVAYDQQADTLVFVEVKYHKYHSPYARRLRSINKKKKRNLLVACNSWRRKQRWISSYRFDVIEIYGDGKLGPEIDHIKNVALFVKGNRFVSWRD